jgi:hypothetical protein
MLDAVVVLLLHPLRCQAVALSAVPFEARASSLFVRYRCGWV